LQIFAMMDEKAFLESRHNLPAQVNRLVGREQETVEVPELLRRDDVRLVTFLGAGGIGKTRLALEVAERLLPSFRDGVYFVSLAAIREPALVLFAIAQALDLMVNDDEPLQKHLNVYLRSRRLLLVLDNFEQIVAAAPQLSNLLGDSPGLKILVTSRAVLHIRGEHEYPVLPLSLPPAREVLAIERSVEYAALVLFTERAQAIDPHFQMTAQNAQTINTICRRLDGLPLAIELAAARSKLLPPQALLAQLEQQGLNILSSPMQDTPSRQQTLRNTLSWSYDLLTLEEQQLFRRLSVFAGGCSLEAIEVVCQLPADRVFDFVTSLLDKSLLLRSETKAGQLRIAMQETIREYGSEYLAAAGEAIALQEAHAAYYSQLAQEAEHYLTGMEQRRWLACLDLEHDNLRVALRWWMERQERGERAGTAQALLLGGALWRYWWMTGQLGEGRHILSTLVERGKDGNSVARARTLNALGTIALLQGDCAEATILCEESLTLYRELDDARGIITSLWVLGYSANERGRPQEARGLLDEALLLARKTDYIWGVAYVLELLAAVAFDQGEYLEARSLIEESLALSRVAGDAWGIGRALWLLALIIFSQGDASRAEQLLRDSLSRYQELHDERGMAYTSVMLGYAAFFRGDYPEMRILLAQGLAAHLAMNDRRGVAWARYGLAWHALISGNADRAHEAFGESLAVLRVLEHRRFIALCVEGMAAAVAAQGHPLWAVRLWGAVEALRERTEVVRPPIVYALYERSRERARTQVGEKAFQAAWAEGRTSQLEDVLRVPIAIVKQGEATSRRTPDYPAGLTAREVEVLRWVAQGLSDSQVAAQLVISPRTVSTHLTSIYNKLGVSSRSAATRFAVEQHLLDPFSR
jgi:predicted ATPase/DNA-binding CsgD family transcriptional regulator